MSIRYRVEKTYFDFLALINVLTKKTIETKVEKNIEKTLRIAILSCLSIADRRGLIRPNNINNVSITTICDINLFSFFTPLFIDIITTPKITGIRAVTGLISLPK